MDQSSSSFAPLTPSAAFTQPKPVVSDEALAGDLIRHLEHLVPPGHYDREGDVEFREGDVFHLGDRLPGKTYTRDPNCNSVYHLDPPAATTDSKKKRERLSLDSDESLATARKEPRLSGGVRDMAAVVEVIFKGEVAPTETDIFQSFETFIPKVPTREIVGFWKDGAGRCFLELSSPGFVNTVLAITYFPVVVSETPSGPVIHARFVKFTQASVARDDKEIEQIDSDVVEVIGWKTCYTVEDMTNRLFVFNLGIMTLIPSNGVELVEMWSVQPPSIDEARKCYLRVRSVEEANLLVRSPGFAMSSIHNCAPIFFAKTLVVEKSSSAILLRSAAPPHTARAPASDNDESDADAFSGSLGPAVGVHMEERDPPTPSPIPVLTADEMVPIEDEDVRTVEVTFKAGNVPTLSMLTKAFTRRIGGNVNTTGVNVKVMDVWAQIMYDPNDGLSTTCFMIVDKSDHVSKLIRLKNFSIDFPNNGGVSKNYVSFKVPTFTPKVRKQWRDIGLQIQKLKKLDEEILAMKAVPVIYDECVLTYELPPHFLDAAALTPKIFTIIASIPLNVPVDITCLVSRPVDRRALFDALELLNNKRILVVSDLRLFQSEGFDFAIPGFN